MKSKFLISLIFIFPILNVFSQNKSDSLILSPELPTSATELALENEVLDFVPNAYIHDSVYINRLAALPFEFNMTYNPTVRRYIELYSSRIKDKIQVIIGLSDFYFPIIDEVFREYKLPGELRYISIIESALNPVAVSSARAIGLWQFMKYTGKENGLVINNVVDQRQDILESTRAAAIYLKKLYKTYNDWSLVLAAYNCGPGRVNKAIARAGGKRDFWKIYKYLPKQTRGYVPEFIGAAYTFVYFREHNMIPVPSAFPLNSDTIWIHKNLHFDQVSNVLGLPIDNIRQMNTQYLKDFIPASDNKQYALRVPLEFKMKFRSLEDSIYAYKSSFYDQLVNVSLKEPNEITHVVRSGESLSVIAHRYHVSVTSIKKWNHLKSNFIRKGQRLVIIAQ
jgi:membrane-bound lytic murein transglycosylase D